MTDSEDLRAAIDMAFAAHNMLGHTQLIDNIEALFTQALTKERQQADKTLDNVLTERDTYENQLDSLSEAVAAYFKQDIGEHSSANDPWFNAFELLRDNTIKGDSRE